MTEKDYIKEAIEDGDSCVEAYESCDLEAMREEGDNELADKIETVLRLIGEINSTCNMENAKWKTGS